MENIPDFLSMYTDYISNHHLKEHARLTTGIELMYSGKLNANANYSCSPRVMDDFYMVFISEGKGKFRCNKKSYNLKKGSLFFLFPGVVHTYETDPEDLMVQWWIGFNGADVQAYLTSISASPQNPHRIIGNHYKEVCRCYETIVHYSQNDCASYYNQLGVFYEILGYLTQTPASGDVVELGPIRIPKEKGIRKALTYFETNYKSEIDMDQVIEATSMSKSQFYIKFKEDVGMTPNNYLLSVRMKQAKHQLENTSLPVKDIAEAVGYKDPLYFSKVFSRYYDSSPSKYREKLHAFAVSQ